MHTMNAQQQFDPNAAVAIPLKPRAPRARKGSERTKEEIEWIPVEEEMPDDGMTVMIATKDGIYEGAEGLWLGYYDSEAGRWVDVNGEYATVIAWAEMPHGPKRR